MKNSAESSQYNVPCVNEYNCVRNGQYRNVSAKRLQLNIDNEYDTTVLRSYDDIMYINRTVQEVLNITFRMPIEQSCAKIVNNVQCVN